jgi:hypothetical protein
MILGLSYEMHFQMVEKKNLRDRRGSERQLWRSQLNELILDAEIITAAQGLVMFAAAHVHGDAGRPAGLVIGDAASGFLFRLRFCFGLSSDFGLGSAVFHPITQSAEAVAQAFAEFRQLSRAEEQQGNKKDHEQVHRLEQTFHKTSRLSACGQ